MTSQSHETLASFRKIQVSSNRKFGWTMGIILIVLSLLPALLRHHPVHLWLLVSGFAILVLVLVAPSLLGPVNRLWFQFGLLLGRVTNPIVMGVLFFAVLTPIGFALRLCGHDLLRLRRDDFAESYWIYRNAGSSLTFLNETILRVRCHSFSNCSIS